MRLTLGLGIRETSLEIKSNGSKMTWVVPLRQGVRLMKKNRFSEEESLEHMVEGYGMIAEEGTSSYQKLMEVVLDESNCRRAG